MKRLISLLLLSCILLSLAGCRMRGEKTEFYYRRVQFLYGTSAQDGVIAAEQRNIDGHSGDLAYLISLYLAGPLDEGLCSPFPETVRMLRVSQADSRLYIELSNMGEDISDAQFTLACACLSMTCMELTDALEVCISSGERILTLSADSLTLFDDVTDTIPTVETTMEDP